ncbi:MAG: hypothetical protein JEZ06_19755 [Anaerolineaceae bacterium]|nr:hypothetical protein [Anaerolineaceae bacterium]
MKTVETICYQAKITPDNLPKPSKHAYYYLKAIRKDEIPLVNQQTQSLADSFKIVGVLRTCDQIQKKIYEFNQNSHKENYSSQKNEKEITSLSAYIKNEVSNIQDICDQNQQLPANLPIRSRNAFKWMKFLSVKENLELHFQAVERVNAIITKKDFRRQIPGKIKRKNLNIKFFQTPNIYKIQIDRQTVNCLLSESLIIANEETLSQVLLSAMRMDKKLFREEILFFLHSEDYLGLSFEIDSIIDSNPAEPIGQVFDLNHIFSLVNKKYFSNKMPIPKLTWNQTFTRRKFGHYQPATDTLMVSISLDQPEIPEFVVEYIMYHELLHKKMGSRIANGRLYSHTPAFRKMEKKFVEYRESQDFLLTLVSR